MARTRKSLLNARAVAAHNNAGARFEAQRSEALRRLRLLTDAVTAAGRDRDVDWGDVGSMGEVVTLLGRAGHFASIEEFTEK